jgi:hypothetical protein
MFLFGFSVKGMFSSIVRPFVAPFPVPLETKQHPVPFLANIPDQAYEAVLPCRVISL